jgi:hypothetical protein
LTLIRVLWLKCKTETGHEKKIAKHKKVDMNKAFNEILSIASSLNSGKQKKKRNNF